MDISKTHRINWQTSFALDALRLCAAITVFLYHGYMMWFPHVFADKLAHFSVIIFFVLSGYLIAYTTTNNNRGAMQYAQARLSKLYSVLLPAILITAVCELIVFIINPVFHAQYTRSPILPRYLLSTFFLNEVGSFSAAPPMNSPLWSLSYECWYYIIFGLWFYLKRSWKSYLILLLAVLIAGPSILLMFPIWLMGCGAYKVPQLKTSFRGSWILFFAAMLVAIILMEYLPAMPFALGYQPLYFANQFITDIIIGFFFAVALSAITNIQSLAPPPGFNKTFRKIADFTFPLYLLHYPLLILWLSIFPPAKASVLQYAVAMSCILPVVIIVGLFIENKRHWWDILISYLLSKLNYYINFPVFNKLKVTLNKLRKR